MSEVYVIRHAPAERGRFGILTEEGVEAAKERGAALPYFAIVIASDAERTQQTAELITGQKPIVDARAGFYMAPPETSERLKQIVTERGVSFWEAAEILGDQEVLDGINAQTAQLHELINETLAELQGNERALIVSHDMTIAPTFKAYYNTDPRPISQLHGYVVDQDQQVHPTQS